MSGMPKLFFRELPRHGPQPCGTCKKASKPNITLPQPICTVPFKSCRSLNKVYCNNSFKSNLGHAYTHRWAHLLKQQSLITIYRLPTKENKRPFFVSVGSDQNKICYGSCHFPPVPFSVCGIPETWKHGIMTWR
jgi:hypothetical protein